MSDDTRKRKCREEVPSHAARHGTDAVDLMRLTLPRLRVDNKILQDLDLYEQDYPCVSITLRIIQDAKSEHISATLESRRRMPKQLWLACR